MFEAIGNRGRVKKATVSLETGIESGQLKAGHRFNWGVDSSFEITSVGDDDCEIVRMASGGLTYTDTPQPNMNPDEPIDTKFYQDRSVDTSEKDGGGYMPPRKPIVGPRYDAGDIKNPANPAGGMMEPKDIMGPYPVGERPMYKMRTPKNDPFSASAIKNPNGGNMNRRPIEELLQGEIFSINSKSKKFVLASISPERDAVVVQADDKSIVFPFSDIKGHQVFVWGRQEEKKEFVPEQFDRVSTLVDFDGKRIDLPGTILSVNAADKTARILWDAPINNKQVTVDGLGDIKALGIKASGKQLDLSQKISVIIKEGEELAKMDSYSRNSEIIREEIGKQVAEEKERVEASTKKTINQLVRLVIDSNLKDFKRIEQAAVDIITVGAHNYQIEEVAGIVRGYQDYVFNRVADTMKTNHVHGSTEFQIPVVTGVMRVLADNMLNSYFLTRNGYIREEGNQWVVYDKEHNLLAKFGDQKKALAQARTRDYRILKGLEA